MTIRTIFSTAEDCRAGVGEGWSEFIRDYAPIARTLLAKYCPSLHGEIEKHVAAVFSRAHDNENAWFSGLHFTNEREFAMAFRELALDVGRSADRQPASNLTVEQVERTLEGLSLVEREFFWEVLKGWDVQEISSMLMNAAATAEAAKRTADEHIRSSMGISAAPERIAAARAGSELVRSISTPDCISWKTCNNLVNGQISWLDRERAEQHIGGCLRCLDAFTALQEMIWISKNSQPEPQPEVERILSALNLRTTRKGLLSRLFSNAS